MFYIYLQELFPGQVHCSCLFFFNLHPSVLSIVVDDGLDARLIVHVLHELLGGFFRDGGRLGLVPLLASIEVLHIDAMYTVITSRMSSECDVLSNVVRGILTHNSPFTRSALLGEYPAVTISGVTGGDVVVPRVGWHLLFAELH